MRIDTGSTPPAPVVTVEQGGDTTQLRRYLRAIRRRWPVLVVFCLIGALVGWVSTPSARGALVDDPVFYQATHTHARSTPATARRARRRPARSTSSRPRSWPTRATSPRRWRERLGIPVADVEENVSASALGGVSSIQVTAVSPDAAKAVLLADTTADELIAVPQRRRLDIRYDAGRDETHRGQGRRRKETQDDARPALAANPDDPELQAEYDSAVNAYTHGLRALHPVRRRRTSPRSGSPRSRPPRPSRSPRAEYNAVRDQIASGPDAQRRHADHDDRWPPSPGAGSTKPASAPAAGRGRGVHGPAARHHRRAAARPLRHPAAPA